jgi:hypothetical protein
VTFGKDISQVHEAGKKDFHVWFGMRYLLIKAACTSRSKKYNAVTHTQ